VSALFLATYSTRHYDFTALAESPEAALTALREAWERHCEQVRVFGLPFYPDDVNVVPIAPGVVLRDGSPI
jgi:hypothetical protein